MVVGLKEKTYRTGKGTTSIPPLYVLLGWNRRGNEEGKGEACLGCMKEGGKEEKRRERGYSSR